MLRSRGRWRTASTGLGAPPPSVAGPTNIIAPAIVGPAGDGATVDLDIGLWDETAISFRARVRITGGARDGEIVLAWTTVTGTTTGSFTGVVGETLVLDIEAANASAAVTVASSAVFGPIAGLTYSFARGLYNQRASPNGITWTDPNFEWIPMVSVDLASQAYTATRDPLGTFGYGVTTGTALTWSNALSSALVQSRMNSAGSSVNWQIDIPPSIRAAGGAWDVWGAASGGSAVSVNVEAQYLNASDVWTDLTEDGTGLVLRRTVLSCPAGEVADIRSAIAAGTGGDPTFLTEARFVSADDSPVRAGRPVRVVVPAGAKAFRFRRHTATSYINCFAVAKLSVEP